MKTVTRNAWFEQGNEGGAGDIQEGNIPYNWPIGQ